MDIAQDFYKIQNVLLCVDTVKESMFNLRYLQSLTATALTTTWVDDRMYMDTTADMQIHKIGIVLYLSRGHLLINYNTCHWK